MHLAEPTTPGPWPGVVVVHEALGLTDDIRAKADRFAARGYLAAAPDLFGEGNVLKCVLGAFRQLNTGKGVAFDTLEAARAELAAHPQCTGKVGIIGFCMGGGFALLCGAKYDFAAAAPNYGQLPRKPDRTLAGSCPVVASYGKKDLTLYGAAKKLDRVLTANGVEHDVKEYPKASHSFMSRYEGKTAVLARVAGLRHRPDDAEDAWRRIDAFFDEHVQG